MDEKNLIQTNIDSYLKRHYAKDLLRFVTVGSVDDGKSTLIGRLLYDSGAVFDDQLAAIKKHKGSVGEGEIDYSLLLDGLLAEREQGITIDVAYRYFSTEKRKFIIADTPGHVQYTRNMATGASTADLGIILIDARLGVLAQSKRHAYIASLLGIPHLVVCVNKMDLVNYSEESFNKIQSDFKPFLNTLGFADTTFIPVSALKGDNIVTVSDKTPWNQLGSLLNFLETVPLRKKERASDFSLPVQYVVRPNLNFRGFAGTITGGLVKQGDEVVVLPSGKKSRVKSIVTFDGDLREAQAPMAITLTLEDEVDVSRGNMLVHTRHSIHVARNLSAMMIWLSEVPLEKGRQYWIKHTSNLVSGVIDSVDHTIDVETLKPVSASSFKLNDIAQVRLSLSRPLMVDLYKHNRQAGSFIVIDRITNATVACGMVNGFESEADKDTKTLALEVTQGERESKLAQTAAVVAICGLPGSGKMVLARALERELYRLGHLACVIDHERFSEFPITGTSADIQKNWSLFNAYLKIGAIVIAPLTLPGKVDQQWLKKQTAFSQLVYIEASKTACEQRLASLNRDPKEAALVFEAPENSDLVVNSENWDLSGVVDSILGLLRKNNILKN